MGKYRVIGNHSVAGVPPGEVVSSEELHGCNIGALVEGGHLEIVQSKAAKAIASAEADEADQPKEQ